MRACALLWVFLIAVAGFESKVDAAEKEGLTLIVMDPLSRELACACVKGFGQRDYRKLAAFLSNHLKEPVSVEFSDDLADTLELIGGNEREYLVVGDQSGVVAAAKKAGLRCEELGRLTDREGKSDLAPWFIIRSDDPAKELKDIAGRKLLVGFPESDSKFETVTKMLRDTGIETRKPTQHLEYNIAALDLLDSEASPLPVVILPSYGLKILEGCGSVKPGNFKVLGKAPATPFITVFTSGRISDEKRRAIQKTLLSANKDPLLLEALESKDGFTITASDDKPRAAKGWPDWRGVNRDGRVPLLPNKLPSAPKIVWKKGAVLGGLAGLSVGENHVLVAERDLADERDVYRCFDAESGEVAWRTSFAATGNLDYGNAPRATPVIHEGKAFVLGAFGDLRCLDMAEGKVVWQRQLIREFSATIPTWGMCSPPLIVDDLIIVNPGGTNASIAGLDKNTGQTRWITPGGPAAYGAFVSGALGGCAQVIGYDQRSLGGWDPHTGQRLWTLIPSKDRDFNVPTPILTEGGIIVATENNGTRLHGFGKEGQIVEEPIAQFESLAPDTTTPVLTNGRIFGMSKEKLYCLDAKTLRPIWIKEEEDLGDHASLIADDERVLVMTMYGELILLDATANEPRVLSRSNLFEEDVEVYAHPALVGSRLYARGGTSVLCVDLSSN